MALVIGGGWIMGLQLYHLARRRVLDPFLVYGLLFTAVKGVAALLTCSPQVYAGSGVMENLLGAALLLGSVAIWPPSSPKCCALSSGSRLS